jgi:hypothetical protein
MLCCSSIFLVLCFVNMQNINFNGDSIDRPGHHGYLQLSSADRRMFFNNRQRKGGILQHPLLPSTQHMQSLHSVLSILHTYFASSSHVRFGCASTRHNLKVSFQSAITVYPEAASTLCLNPSQEDVYRNNNASYELREVPF